MNERGFFTIVGLCLLLVAAIFIKGVHEFEANYARGITNFQAEHELQNAADSALITAIETKSTATQNFTSEKFGNISVEIRCEQISDSEGVFIRRFERRYLSANKIQDTPLNENNTRDIGTKESPADTTPEWLKQGKIWIGVASCDSPFIAGKMYRRAFAYILDDDPETEEIDESATIHFLNSL